jgi:hypothetical protein
MAPVEDQNGGLPASGRQSYLLLILVLERKIGGQFANLNGGLARHQFVRNRFPNGRAREPEDQKRKHSRNSERHTFLADLT